MKKLVSLISVEQIQAFFFEAMRDGWASGNDGVDIPDMPLHRKIEFQTGDLRFEEVYKVSEDLSARLSGKKTIFFRDEPVWVMEHKGRCQEEDVTFLRQALMLNYDKGIFIGGRGPVHFAEGDLAYENRTFPSNFLKFCGHEKVHANGRAVSEIYSHYTYFGGITLLG